MTRASAPERPPVDQSLREYARGIVGGLLFSLPLLYTMEVWWAGFRAGPAALLVYFVAGFLLLFAYNRYTGLRQDSGWLEVGIEAFEEMGLGLGLAAAMLWLVGQIGGETSFREALGKVVVEGVIVAIGVSVGAAQLGGGDGDMGMGSGPISGKGRGKGSGKGRAKGSGPGHQALERMGLSGELVLSACGAILLAANVAPTEEITMIAVETPPAKVLGIALLSLALSAMVLFHSDLTGSRLERERDRGLLATTSSSVTHYAVALAVSAFLLWFFGHFAGNSLAVCAAETVVLGAPAALGSAVGRVLLQ